MLLISQHSPFVILEVLDFIAIPDTCSVTEDFQCFIQFSKEKRLELPFSCMSFSARHLNNSVI